MNILRTESMSTLIAGNRLIWLSIIVFLIFFIWQFNDWLVLFHNEKSLRNYSDYTSNFIKFFLILTTGLFFVFLYGESQELRQLFNLFTTNSSVPRSTVFFEIVSRLGRYMYMSAFVIMFFTVPFLYGKLSMGATVSVGLHNYLNGGVFSFDIALALVDFSFDFITNIVPESGAFILQTIWFVSSFFINRLMRGGDY